MEETKSLREILPGLAWHASFRLAILNIDEKPIIVKDVENVEPILRLSYYKLPETLLKLSVLKLDGNFFEVKVSGSASVGELKQAVEDVFNQSLSQEQGAISWCHVWGNFCLCYQHYKLTNDKESLSHFRIKDGDQLQFIRHLSNHVPQKHAKKRAKSHERCKSSAGSDNIEREVEDDQTYEKYTKDNHKIHSYKSLDVFKFAHALKKWISMRSKRKVHFHGFVSNGHSRDEEMNRRFTRLRNSP